MKKAKNISFVKTVAGYDGEYEAWITGARGIEGLPLKNMIVKSRNTLDNPTYLKL